MTGWEGRRGPRGRRAATAGALLAAVVIGTLALATLDPRDPETRVVTRSPGSAGPLPETILALSRRGGRVVLLDSATGKVMRVLATGRPTLQGVALAPDGRTAYYSVSSGCGGGTIYRVPLDGSARSVAEGVSPAVSPDGRALAYAAPGEPRPGGLRTCHNVVFVRDLATGAERMWRYPDDEDHRSALYHDGEFTKLAWAPDSRRLAITLSYEGDSVSVLDTDAHRDLSEAVEVVVPGGGGDSRHPAWQGGSGRLAVVNRAFECCFEDDYTGPPRTLLVDVAKRLSEDLLPPGLQPTWLDFDATGDHLLYVEGSRLYRRAVHEVEPVLVAAGYAAADW